MLVSSAPIENMSVGCRDDALRQPGGYVGLRNGGATCYMNATLQQLFMQPRIRESILAAKPVDKEEQRDSVFHQLQVR